MLIEEPTSVQLKDGRTVLLRPYRAEDKEELVTLYASLSPETLRWSLPPYDREKIDRWTSDPSSSIILMAWSETRAVGHLQVFLRTFSPRLKGLGELIIYLHQDYQNVGLGTAMMREAVRLAREKGLHRLSLSVIADNRPAIRIYEKVGFHHEGLRLQEYFGEDGKYHDVVEMGLLL